MYAIIWAAMLAGMARAANTRGCREYCNSLHHNQQGIWRPECACSVNDHSFTKPTFNQYSRPTFDDSAIYYVPSVTHINPSKTFADNPFYIANPAYKKEIKKQTKKVNEKITKKKDEHNSNLRVSNGNQHETKSTVPKIYILTEDVPFYLDIDIHKSKNHGQSSEETKAHNLKLSENDLIECVDLHIMVFSRNNDMDQELEDIWDVNKIKKYSELSDSDLMIEIQNKCRHPANIIKESVEEITSSRPKKSNLETNQKHSQDIESAQNENQQNRQYLETGRIENKRNSFESQSPISTDFTTEAKYTIQDIHFDTQSDSNNNFGTVIAHEISDSDQLINQLLSESTESDTWSAVTDPEIDVTDKVSMTKDKEIEFETITLGPTVTGLTVTPHNGYSSPFSTINTFSGVSSEQPYQVTAKETIIPFKISEESTLCSLYPTSTEHQITEKVGSTEKDSNLDKDSSEHIMKNFLLTDFSEAPVVYAPKLHTTAINSTRKNSVVNTEPKATASSDYPSISTQWATTTMKPYNKSDDQTRNSTDTFASKSLTQIHKITQEPSNDKDIIGNTLNGIEKNGPPFTYNLLSNSNNDKGFTPNELNETKNEYTTLNNSKPTVNVTPDYSKNIESTNSNNLTTHSNVIGLNNISYLNELSYLTTNKTKDEVEETPNIERHSNSSFTSHGFTSANGIYNSSYLNAFNNLTIKKINDNYEVTPNIEIHDTVSSTSAYHVNGIDNNSYLNEFNSLTTNKFNNDEVETSNIESNDTFISSTSPHRVNGRYNISYFNEFNNLTTNQFDDNNKSNYTSDTEDLNELSLNVDAVGGESSINNMFNMISNFRDPLSNKENLNNAENVTFNDFETYLPTQKYTSYTDIGTGLTDNLNIFTDKPSLANYPDRNHTNVQNREISSEVANLDKKQTVTSSKDSYENDNNNDMSVTKPYKKETLLSDELNKIDPIHIQIANLKLNDVEIANNSYLNHLPSNNYISKNVDKINSTHDTVSIVENKKVGPADYPEQEIKIPKIITHEYSNDTVVSEVRGFEVLPNDDFKKEVVDSELSNNKTTLTDLTGASTEVQVNTQTFQSSSQRKRYNSHNDYEFSKESQDIIGKLYFLFGDKMVPAQFVQGTDGQIKLRIDSKSFCDKLLQKQLSDSLMMVTLCKCSQSQNCTKAINELR